MALLSSTIADDLANQLKDFDELSVDDIHRRMQWLWRQMLAAARDIEAIELQLVEAHKIKDPAWDLAYESSILSQEKRLNARYHEAYADNRCREHVEIIKGLEAQLRIVQRWFTTMDKIHHGLQTHAADIRRLAS